jgi:hypothetical protein
MNTKVNSNHTKQKLKRVKQESSKFKPAVSDIKATLTELRENQKLDLVNIEEEELLSKVCSTSSNKSDVRRIIFIHK